MKIIYALIIELFLCSSFSYAQQNRHKSAPLDYIWQNVGNAGFSEPVFFISFAFSPLGEPYIAYTIGYSSPQPIGVMKFDGNNWMNVGTTGVLATYEYVTLAFSPSGDPCIAFNENIEYVGGLISGPTVMKFNGSSWEYVGDGCFSNLNPVPIMLAFSPSSGEPYVAFGNNGYSPVVMRFDGSYWVGVGDGLPGIFCSFDFSPVGEPYIGIINYLDSKASVMKFDGSNWVYVGNPGFSEGDINNLSLEVSQSGEPYVAINDDFGGLSVMKYNGNSWEYVGNAGFAAGEYISTCTKNLTINPSGEPYIVFSGSAILEASVMKFDGGSWVYVGDTNFSSSWAFNANIAINPMDDRVYVAYGDGGNFEKATVMKYDYMTGLNELKYSKLSFYYNPATDKLNIETPEKGSLSFHNTNGQQLLQQEITEPKTTVDVSRLKSGVYMVRVIDEKGVQVGKFIKQ